MSTQTALWRRDTLLELMREGESIWQFEIYGTQRSNDLAGEFYCTWKPVMTYRHHVVEKGKWFAQEARKFGAMRIGCDFSRREIMTAREMLWWRCHLTQSILFVRPLRRWWRKWQWRGRQDGAPRQAA